MAAPTAFLRPYRRGNHAGSHPRLLLDSAEHPDAFCGQHFELGIGLVDSEMDEGLFLSTFY